MTLSACTDNRRQPALQRVCRRCVALGVRCTRQMARLFVRWQALNRRLSAARSTVLVGSTSSVAPCSACRNTIRLCGLLARRREPVGGTQFAMTIRDRHDRSAMHSRAKRTALQLQHPAGVCQAMTHRVAPPVAGGNRHTSGRRPCFMGSPEASGQTAPRDLTRDAVRIIRMKRLFVPL